MISMTTYWQQFKECIDNLQLSKDDKECTRQLLTANSMIEIGLSIEQLGITEIKQVVNRLSEKAKSFENEVSFTTDKEYTFYLPKIINAETLVFAVIYYQHLSNYETVSYQGSIGWPFKEFVSNQVKAKKITTDIQAKALLNEIEKYCQSQNSTVNPAQLLKESAELPKEYSERISKMFVSTIKSDTKPQASSISDEIVKIEELLENLNIQRRQIKTKIDSLTKKIADYDQAKQTHQILNSEWQSKWLITKIFYWIIALVYPVPLVKNLKTAQEKLVTAENILNQEMAPHENIESYRTQLKTQQEKIINEYTETQEQLILKVKLKESMQKEDKIIPPKTPSIPKIAINTPPRKEESESSFDLNYYYGFFKEHLPSRYVVQAVAVGAAAIAIQNLM